MQSRRELLAQAGRDLFLSGITFDGTNKEHMSSHHPARTPNLGTIPEKQTYRSTNKNSSSTSEIIVIIGGPLNVDLSPGVWLKNRIKKSIQLYQSLQHKRRNTNSITYMVPTGGDADGLGIMEAEITRNELTKAGIPPHQIIMDCNAFCTIDNAHLLLPVLRHLQISSVHVVTSEFHVPRVKLIFDGILGAVTDMDFSVFYYGAKDEMSPKDRAERDATEQSLLIRSRNYLGKIIEDIHREFPSQNEIQNTI